MEFIFRSNALSSRYNPGKDPNGAAIFLVKEILAALTFGSSI